MKEKFCNIKKEIKEIWEHKQSRNLILSLLSMFFLVIASEIITFDRNLIKANSLIVFFILFMLSFCFNYIFNKTRIGFLITYLYIFILSVLDYFVYKSTSNHFTISNILSAKTAYAVFDGVFLKIDTRFIIAIIFFVISFIALINIKHNKQKRDKKMSLICSVIIVFVFSLITFTNLLGRICIIDGLNYSHSQVESTTYILYFHSGINDFIASRATKNDVEKAENILSSYENNKKEIEEKPNVVILMCEALTDYYIYEDFKTTTSYMPYIQSLQKEYTSGYIIPPYVGGGTCDSEFEFLTGMSLDNISLQAMSYNRYLNKKDQTFPSMVSNFKNQGYYTIAMHPGNDISYNRNVVYKALQFDEMYFNTDIDSSNDKYLFDFINNNINNNEKPLFQFGVTIFNHSPYVADGTEIDYLDIDGCNEKFEANMNRYLTNVNETDKYLQEFIENIKEPTIVVIFGDHQPILSNEMGCTFITEEDKSKVPYIIWSNCDYDFNKMPKNLSGNYFASYFLNCMDYPLSEFAQYQLDISKESTNIRDENLEKNKDYESIQKYYLFKKNMNIDYFE